MRQILRSKNGFSLPELLAVMAIMAILAATSAPFIRGYLRDAGNNKAKAVLQDIADGYKTFMADYPNRTFAAGSFNSSSVSACTVNDADNQPGLLKACHYINNYNWSSYKYDFYLGSVCCSDAPSGSIACMRGNASAGDYTSTYCAWVDKYGTMDDNKN